MDLCNICSIIPFAALASDLPSAASYLRNNGSAATKLGPLSQIRRRSCPLCQLVTVATLTVERTENRCFQPSQEVGVLWAQSSAGRGAYGFNLIYHGIGPSRGTTICFTLPVLSAGSDQPPTIQHAWFKKIDRVVIDFDRIRWWIQDCDQNHQSCCRSPAEGYGLPWDFPGVAKMRFVDVSQRCVVEKTVSCRYIALSYVWGTVPAIRLFKSNRHQLMRPGSLGDNWELVPRTIQDAMDLVERLGERYLWVDSLCLIQNDDDDVRAGTAVMDLVYERSVLTIAAACGHDSSHGLPGVRSGSRIIPFYSREVAPNLHLTIYTAPTALMASAVYSSRAWTLQEEVLSRRVLYFVGDQVFFRCRLRDRSENLLDNLDGNSAPEEYSSPSEFDLRNYAILLQRYSMRTLTYQDDAHNALAGIVRRFETVNQVPFVGGLPSKFLDFFLTFKATKLSLRRRKGFPSYSWSGWIGPLEFSSQLMREIAVLPREAKGFLTDRSHWITWYQGFLNPGVSSEGFPLMPIVHMLPGNPTPDPFPQIAGFRPPFPMRTAPSDFEVTFNNELLPRAPSRFISSLPQYPLLKFWTLSVFLRLGDVDLGSKATLLNRQNQDCGELYLDGHGETSFFDDHMSKGTPPALELILLFRVRTDGSRIFGQSVTGWRLWDSDYFVVMCIEWQPHVGSDGRNVLVAERRGIGQITEEAVTHSFAPGPRWNEITLG